MHSTTRLVTVARMIQAVCVPLQTGAKITTQRVIIFPENNSCLSKEDDMESSAPGARYGDFKVGQGSGPILADVMTVGCSSGRLNRFGNIIIEFPNSSSFHVITCISSMSSTWNKDDICLTRNSFTSVSATLTLTLRLLLCS